MEPFDYEKESAVCRKEADRCLAEIRRLSGKGNSDEIYIPLRKYILARFLLLSRREELIGEDSINELSAESIAMIYRIPASKLKNIDRPTGCTYATSVTDRKILLLLALQEVSGKQITAAMAPKIRTIRELAELLARGENT